MTEEEAKTKWCPMYRRSAINEKGFTSDNRDQSYSINCYCIASECMWWVRDGKDDKAGRADQGHCGAIK